MLFGPEALTPQLMGNSLDKSQLVCFCWRCQRHKVLASAFLCILLCTFENQHEISLSARSPCPISPPLCRACLAFRWQAWQPPMENGLWHQAWTLKVRLGNLGSWFLFCCFPIALNWVETDGLQLALGAEVAWLSIVTIDWKDLWVAKSPELAVGADLVLRGLLMPVAWRPQFQRVSQEGTAPNLQPQRKRVKSTCVYGGWGGAGSFHGSWCNATGLLVRSFLSESQSCRPGKLCYGCWQTRPSSYGKLNGELGLSARTVWDS